MAWKSPHLGRAALPLALLLCQLREAQLLFAPGPPSSSPSPSSPSHRPLRATSGDPASIGIVEPLVNQLPRQERETFMGLLRFLSLPVDDVWFSAILLILVRFRLVKKLVMASQHWRRWLTTYCRRLRSQEDRSLLIEALDTNQVLQKTIRLSGGGFLRQGARLVSPAYVGDTLELGGFENMALNTEFVLCKAEGLQHGKPVFQSRNKEFMLSSAITQQGKVWIVSPDEKFQQTKNQGSPEGLPLKRYGALLVSPVDAHLLEAPQLNWQELTESGKWIMNKNAGLVKIRRPALPLQVRVMPPTAPSIIDYSDSYVQAMESPLVVWATFFLILEVIQFFFLHKASTKALSNRIIKFMSRLRWLLTSTCACLALFRLSSRWKERRSRGKAVISDVLGVQSSQREARLSALTILMQTFVVCSWWIWVLAICGIKVGRLLLSTSVGALLLGFVGRDVLSNMLSCLVIYLTQPFAQGDWITLEEGQDGWAEEIGLFYTKVIQWDKRPLYVPNFRIVQMLVQNNSRMTNRRVRFDFKLRLQDIPKVPAIVEDIKNMIIEHPQIDSVTHRLVGWRQVGDYSANIWLSCYTKSTEQDIKLSHYIAVEQSVLERCTPRHGQPIDQTRASNRRCKRRGAIIYKHKADFASSTELTVLGGGAPEAAELINDGYGGPAVTASSGKAPNGAKDGAKVTARVVQEKHDIPARERELHDSRNAVLQAGEEQLRKQKAEVEKKEKELKDKEQELKEKEHRLAALEAQEEGDEQGEEKVKVVTEPDIAT